MQQTHLFVQLFLRETGAQTLCALSDVNLAVQRSQKYRSWLNSKRELVLSDIENCHWIKTCTGGYITEVVFHPDGTLDEFRLFDRFQTKGKWSLENGVLNIEIEKGENTYSFAVVGNAAINIHSAVEHKNGELHSYLKLSQIK